MSDFQQVRVGHGVGDVWAIEWSTEDCPYVIKGRPGMRVDREIPWREGNRTRAADRGELISLVNTAEAVRIEMRGVVGQVTLAKRNIDRSTNEPTDVQGLELRVSGVLVCTPPNGKPASYLQNRSRAEAFLLFGKERGPSWELDVTLRDRSAAASYRLVHGDRADFAAPGQIKIELRGWRRSTEADAGAKTASSCLVRLYLAGAPGTVDRSITLELEARRDERRGRVLGLRVPT
jgi:hypothetical protein